MIKHWEAEPFTGPGLGRVGVLDAISRHVSMALLGSLCLLGAGCSVAPQSRESLSIYVKASDQVQQAAGELIDDYESRSKAQDARKRANANPGQPAPEYPDTFYPPGSAEVVLTDQAKALAETRQALEVIHAYSDVLLSLADGRSDQEVRAQTAAFGAALQGLLAIAGKTITGLSLFTEAGSKIIKLAQDAANRKQLVEAVNKGREPVGIILGQLERQTKSMYDLSVVGTKQTQFAARTEIAKAAAALAAQSARHGPPRDVAVAARMAALQAEAGDIAGTTQTNAAVKIPFPFVAGKPAAGAAAVAEVEIFVQAMRTSAQKYAELVAAQNAYYAAMGKYVAALRQSRKSFDQLAASLAAPADLRVEFSRLLNTAFELRDAVTTYRSRAASAAL